MLTVVSKNVSKKKNQSSIKRFFGWSTTSQASSPDNQNRNFDLNEDLNILGHDEECMNKFKRENLVLKRKEKSKKRVS